MTILKRGGPRELPKQTDRVNERIRAREVLVIDEDGSKLGILPPHEALAMAQARELDLVEISPTANPPVCRIMDYGKWRYQQSKKDHDAKRRQHHSTVKEIKFRPSVDDQDFDFKKNHVLRFLQQGDKVKILVLFRGRERSHRDIGEGLLRRVIAEVAEYGTIESATRPEGPHLQVVLAPKPSKSQPKPKKQKEEGGKPGRPGAQEKTKPASHGADKRAAGEAIAKAEDTQGSGQAVQGDGNGEGAEGTRVQVAHPDEKDPQA